MNDWFRRNDIIEGDCVSCMSKMDSDTIDLTVTSPPYDQLRDYKGYSFDFENTAKQLYRITKPGGVVVWVVGDSVINGSESGTSFKQALYFKEIGFNLHDTMIYQKASSSLPDPTRYYQSFEYMFVFSKKTKPKTAHLLCDKPNRWAGYTHFGKGTIRTKDGQLKDRQIKPIPEFSPRNNIWKYNTGKGYSTKDDVAFEHPAIFPEKLARDHILSWSNEGDLVLDPFMGSGTTAVCCLETKRKFIGFEIDETYHNICTRRLEQHVTVEEASLPESNPLEDALY